MILSSLQIWDEISKERARQDAIWGGAEHDDKQSPKDWINYTDQYLTEAAISLQADHDESVYRRKMIQVAALAVAAVESYDRKKN